MERNIKSFRNTMSVSAFRKANNTEEKVQIVESNQTLQDGPFKGRTRVFFALGTPKGRKTGSVSHKFYEGTLTKPVISEIETTEGEWYFLIHQEGELKEAVAEFE